MEVKADGSLFLTEDDTCNSYYLIRIYKAYEKLWSGTLNYAFVQAFGRHSLWLDLVSLPYSSDGYWTLNHSFLVLFRSWKVFYDDKDRFGRYLLAKELESRPNSEDLEVSSLWVVFILLEVSQLKSQRNNYRVQQNALIQQWSPFRVFFLHWNIISRKKNHYKKMLPSFWMTGTLMFDIQGHCLVTYDLIFWKSADNIWRCGREDRGGAFTDESSSKCFLIYE